MLRTDFRGIFQENNLHNHEILWINKETSDCISREIIISNVSITHPYPSAKDDAMQLNIYCLKFFFKLSYDFFQQFCIYICVTANVVN